MRCGARKDIPWSYFAALADSLNEPEGVKSSHEKKLAVKFSFGGENQIDIVEMELTAQQPIRGLAQPVASSSNGNTKNAANEW